VGGVKPEIVAQAYQDLIKLGPEDIRVEKSFEEYERRLRTPENEKSYNSKFLKTNRRATAGKHGRKICRLANEFLRESKIPKSCKKISKRFNKKK